MTGDAKKMAVYVTSPTRCGVTLSHANIVTAPTRNPPTCRAALRNFFNYFSILELLSAVATTQLKMPSHVVFVTYASLA